jgi:hypothetical protein
MVASSTGVERANERVWAVAGSTASARARGGSRWRTGLTCGDDALARPVRGVACSGASWTSLGALGLVSVLLYSDDGVYQRVQESEREVLDTVVHDGKARREEWHVCVPCHARHGSLVTISCTSSCLWCLASCKEWMRVLMLTRA